MSGGPNERPSAQQTLRDIHDILFPVDEPERAWSPDTIQEVGALVEEHFPLLTFHKKVANLIDNLADVAGGDAGLEDPLRSDVKWATEQLRRSS